MPDLTVEEMQPANGPGWSIDIRGADGEPIVTYMLWAPRRSDRWSQQQRDNWYAHWEMALGTRGDQLSAATATEALAVFVSCPRTEEADAAARELLAAADNWLKEVRQS